MVRPLNGELSPCSGEFSLDDFEDTDSVASLLVIRSLGGTRFRSTMRPSVRSDNTLGGTKAWKPSLQAEERLPEGDPRVT